MSRVELINPRGNVKTSVVEERLQEYLEAGFKLASPPVEKPTKAQTKKKTTTKK